MPIPKEILGVPRPKNTVVVAYGKDKQLYAVRQRVGCRRVGGRNLPVNGPTVGHIVSGEYVALGEGPGRVSQAGVDLKDWANIELCDAVFSGILGELCAVYDRRDALQIYCISVLRVCDPGIKDYELKEAYDTSFLSELYPGVALSRNTVSRLFSDLGKACSRIVAFMRARAAAVGIDHHLLIDGTLKPDESKVNTLSDFSRKARAKGTRDISVLYAFDLEAMEPVCSKCYPGNMADVTSYESFLAENAITRGLVVADKGFPAAAAQAWFGANPDLHYLSPLKRNSRQIEAHGLYDHTGILPGEEGVTYRKEKGKGCWLYSFRDARMAAKEEQDWLRRAKKKGDYDHAGFERRRRAFGTIVLQSDLDMEPALAYKAYSTRWEIELVMRYYKSACEFDETRVHDDYSVIGSELCNFLSSLLTFRLIARFDGARLLEKRTYKAIMAALARAKKARVDGCTWSLVKISPAHEEMLSALGLLPSSDTAPLKRKRGRPKKTGI